MRDVIIVGGGASGLVAAIVAARKGTQVCIIERSNRVGKKILVTGNGRCNMTNTQITPKQYHSYDSVDIKSVLERFGYEETKNFFMELGIMPLIEGKKVYPLSEQATSVLDVLRMEIERLGVEVITDTKITELKPKKEGWQLFSEEGQIFEAHKVIMATGGMTNTSLGCDGLGYEILKKLGHTLKAPFPILVHILSSSPYCKMMKGTKVKANVKIFVEGKLGREEYGEVLFTEDGLSGPPIFQISRVASLAALNKQDTELTLDLFPNLSEDEMISLLYERITAHPERTIEQLLIGMLHKRVIMPVLKAAHIESIHRLLEQLEYDEVMRLVQVLKAFNFSIQGTRGYKFAQVTAGGIRATEIDFQTMASLKAKNLYITGEVMDVDGDCGGYNLQWAWATGFIAGESVSRNEDNK
ncbi:MAG: NAD(P)/FAD-dependent oxidoreductase [Cellulosilyticum sp.]|nr:NAD(P)/FAD-dependent oxidoreductase [Cellulosilyticum sp.]